MTEDKELWTLFSAEAEEHLQLLDAGLLRLEKDATDRATIELVFRSAHSLKGAARMMGALAVEQQAHGFEDALTGAIRRGDALEEATIERLYHDLDALRASVNQALATQSDATDNTNNGFHHTESISNAPNVARNATDVALNTTNVGLNATNVEHNATNVALNAANVALNTSNVGLNATNVALNATHVALNATHVEANATNIGHNSTDGASELAVRTAETVAAPAPAWKIETMRVDTARLDGLLSMAGEMVVSTKRAGRSRTEFDFAETLREDVQKLQMQQKRALRHLESTLGAGAPLLRDIERLFDQYGAKWDALNAVTGRLRGAHDDMVRLESVVGELEAEIRGVRLLPLSTLFGQFPRSVRDLAKAQNKSVDFSIEGAETKADKRVIEELKDPLMHMVRNAVDHGIETAAARLEAGKNPVASLVLRGSQTATHIVIELEDDGRGLDVEAIRASALRKNIASETELQAMSARQVQDLIFAPGFSTAARLTDVSGRGVGLDVVRENVARLRGTVEVESRPGRGCTFRLTLPLTLATTRVLLVRAGGQTLALPIEDIASVQLLAPAATYPLRGRRHFTLGEEPVVLADLARLLALTPAVRGHESAPCIVLAVGGQRLGLLVDAIIEEQEIILKAPNALLQNSRHIAGATILETGDVCLLLASAELMQIAARQVKGGCGRARPARQNRKQSQSAAFGRRFHRDAHAGEADSGERGLPRGDGGRWFGRVAKAGCR